MTNLTKWNSIFSRCSLQYKNNELKSLGICGSTTVYFFYLSRNPNVTQGEIARNIMVNKSNVTRTLQSLEEKGFIKKEEDPNNKKINRISLTSKGEQMVPIIREKMAIFNESIIDGFSSEEIETLNKLLYKLTCNATNYVKTKYNLDEEK